MAIKSLGLLTPESARMPRASRLASVPFLVTATMLIGLAGCSSRIYPVTTGFHVPGETLVEGGRVERYVIWADHPGLQNELASLLLQRGHTVVERAHVDQLFSEQRFRLIHTPDEEVLRVGAMVGATQVIFVRVEPAYRASSSERLSVNLRSVQVESGTVQWVAGATLETDSPFVITSPEQSVLSLTRWAFQRALCPVEHGWRWEEQSADTDGGCLAPDAGRP